MKTTGIVYDLDGTLVDSAPDIAAALNKTLDKRGFSTLPVEEIEKLIGTGSRNICRLSLEVQGAEHDDAYLDEMVPDFLETYRQSPVVHTKLYPSVVTALERHAELGLVQGICTNKTNLMSELVISGLGLSHLFSVNIGADATKDCKPHPGHLMDVVSRMNCEMDDIVFVGDTEVDLECAKAAGVRFFVVSWGRDEALNDGYGTVVQDFSEIEGLLN